MIEARFIVSAQPDALPKWPAKPIDLTIRGEVLPDERGRVPALKTLLVDLDRDIVVNADDWPICRRRDVVGYSTNPEGRRCAEAVIGGGTATVKTPSRSMDIHLYAYNGGVRGKTTTIFVRTTLENSPLILAKVVLAPGTERRGLHAVWTIPPLIGGVGSLVDFRLALQGTVAPHSEGPNYLEARCSDGWLQTGFEARFRPESDGDIPEPVRISSLSPCSSNAEQP